MSDSSNEYTTRAGHSVNHFHEVIIVNEKAIYLQLNEPDKYDMVFLKRTTKPKVTIINNLDYPFL